MLNWIAIQGEIMRNPWNAHDVCYSMLSDSMPIDRCLKTYSISNLPGCLTFQVCPRSATFFQNQMLLQSIYSADMSSRAKIDIDSSRRRASKQRHNYCVFSVAAKFWGFIVGARALFYETKDGGSIAALFETHSFAVDVNQHHPAGTRGGFVGLRFLFQRLYDEGEPRKSMGVAVLCQPG